MCQDKFPIGTRVKVTREYDRVPIGTEGIIDEHWKALTDGITVAWDLKDQPLPADYKYNSDNPQVVLRDGFSCQESTNLKIIK